MARRRVRRSSCPDLARYIGVDPADVIYVAEYCGGGFGSKGGGYPIMSLPAHLSKKIGRPVLMLRDKSQSEEYFNRRRPSGVPGSRQNRLLRHWPDHGGRLVHSCRIPVPNRGGGDYLQRQPRGFAGISAGEHALSRPAGASPTLAPRGAQRGPGENQIACAVEPLLDRAALPNWASIASTCVKSTHREWTASRPTTGAGERGPVTSARLADALDLGAERFGYAQRMQRAGQRNGYEADRHRRRSGVPHRGQ